MLTRRQHLPHFAGSLVRLGVREALERGLSIHAVGSRRRLPVNSSVMYQRKNSVGVATLGSLRRPDNDSRFEAFGLTSN